MTRVARRSGYVPVADRDPGWAYATEVFLRRDLAPGSRRIYRLTLERVGAELPAGIRVSEVDSNQIEHAVTTAYTDVQPATWNRVLATVGSFESFCRNRGWTEGFTQTLERRHVPVDHGRALSREDVERLLSARHVGLRERTLWRLLYETAARTEEVLQLNVEDIDLPARRAYTIRKGGARDVLHFATASARLLPKLIDGRTTGPLFLAERPAAPSRVPAAGDIDTATGRARLSYRRAAEMFKETSGGATLHQLRHSALTHLAEAGVPTVLLMAKSRHASLRTLQRYAQPGVEAVARLTAEHDPARRRSAR